MKKFIIQLVIICFFAMGFGGSCYRIPHGTDNPLFNLILGISYNGASTEGFVDYYYLASAGNGKIYRSTDPAIDSWTEINSGTSNDIYFLADCELSDTGVVFGVGESGTIIRTLDQGLTWTVLNSGVTDRLNGIDFINLDLNTIMAVGNSGLIIRSTNGGENWFTVTSGVTKNLNSIYSLNNFVNFIAGDDGTLLRSSNGGVNWVNVSLADTVNDLNKVGTMSYDFFGTILAIVGDNGNLYRSTISSNYLFWSPVPTGTAEDLYEIQFRNASSGFVSGENGEVRYTIDGGNEWFSDLYISSLTTERISSALIINDTMALALTEYEINLLHANQNVQPVELSAFSHTVINNNVNLHWATSSEVNNSGFEIERRDARRETLDAWNMIGFVNGYGTTSSPNTYEFEDRGLNSGKYNYRLKQIDYNGNFEYFNLSGEVVIGVPDKFELSQNYPNPFNPTTNLEYGNSNLEFVSLKVYDISGKEVMTLVNEFKNPGRYAVKFDGSNLSSGVYFYKLQAGDFTDTKRMVLLK